MNKRFIILILYFILILSTVCCIENNQTQGNIINREVIYQFSTIDGLLEGVYDGNLTFRELKEHGDYGIGTFDSLDGEMIQVQGKFYQIKSDGVAYPVNEDQKTPFAVVSFFDRDDYLYIDQEVNYDKLTKLIDSKLPTKNIFYLILIKGNFEYVKTRSVPIQSKPYVPLAKAVEGQKIFEFNDVNGTLVGFRSPDYVGSINVPGYHFHFLTADEKAGGHVLDLTIKTQNVEIDYTSDLFLDSPENLEYLGYTSEKERNDEFEVVEKSN